MALLILFFFFLFPFSVTCVLFVFSTLLPGVIFNSYVFVFLLRNMIRSMRRNESPHFYGCWCQVF